MKLPDLTDPYDKITRDAFIEILTFNVDFIIIDRFIEKRVNGIYYSEDTQRKYR